MLGRGNKGVILLLNLDAITNAQDLATSQTLYMRDELVGRFKHSTDKLVSLLNMHSAVLSNSVDVEVVVESLAAISPFLAVRL